MLERLRDHVLMMVSRRGVKRKNRARYRRNAVNFDQMSFPSTRLRRMRQTDSLRSLVRETRLTPTGFIYPLFVCPGEGVRKEISSMPGVFNISVDEAVKEAREAKSLGVGGIILFGLPEKKDEVATGAWAEDGIVQRATRAIKREVRDLVVVGDVCLCEYMSHGHCGIVQKKNSAAGSRLRQSAATAVQEIAPLRRRPQLSLSMKS